MALNTGESTLSQPGFARALPAGSLVALVTPFGTDDELDIVSLRPLIEWHIQQGSAGLVIAGTTGEASTLSMDEHVRLLHEAVQCASGRIPIMAGVGANSTREAVELARLAARAQVDALLSVVPYYNKPSDEGIYQHFWKQADASDVPLVLYSVPGRTVVDLSAATILRLATHPRIRGLKDATGDMARAQEIASLVPAGFALYSGDDFTTLPYLTLGGRGVISVTANVMPRAVSELCEALAQGELQRARQLAGALHPVHLALFQQSNPIAVKHAVSSLGLCGPTLRLPLTRLPPDQSQRVEQAMVNAGLLERPDARCYLFH